MDSEVKADHEALGADTNDAPVGQRVACRPHCRLTCQLPQARRRRLSLGQNTAGCAAISGLENPRNPLTPRSRTLVEQVRHLKPRAALAERRVLSRCAAICLFADHTVQGRHPAAAPWNSS